MGFLTCPLNIKRIFGVRSLELGLGKITVKEMHYVNQCSPFTGNERRVIGKCVCKLKKQQNILVCAHIIPRLTCLYKCAHILCMTQDQEIVSTAPW